MLSGSVGSPCVNSEPDDGVVNLLTSEPERPEAEDVGHQSGGQHVRRHGISKYAIADEENDVLEN